MILILLRLLPISKISYRYFLISSIFHDYCAIRCCSSAVSPLWLLPMTVLLRQQATSNKFSTKLGTVTENGVRVLLRATQRVSVVFEENRTSLRLDLYALHLLNDLPVRRRDKGKRTIGLSDYSQAAFYKKCIDTFSNKYNNP